MQPVSHFAQHLAGTRLRDCFDLWLSQRQGTRPPKKSAIHPADFAPVVLPHLFLYELIEDGRFKCRLAGTAIGFTFGKDPTGRYLDELVSPASLPGRTALFHATLEKELAVVYGGNLEEGDSRWRPFKRLLLPLCDEHGRTRFVFGMVIFPRPDGSYRIERAARDLPHDFEAWATAEDLAAELISAA
jgi:hypothetical protein